MAVTTALVKELRERTGAGMMDCKKALTETDGDIELAIENMRKSGAAKAAKKAGNIAAEGTIIIKQNAGVAVLVEVNCQTDFVAKDESFLAFANKVADAAIAETVTIEDLQAKFEEDRVELVTKIGENINVRRLQYITGEQLVEYRHGERIGVVVAGVAEEETLKHVAMHVAASNPDYLTPDDVPADVVEKEKQVQIDIAMNEGKPAEIAEKMVVGRINKFLAENSLVEQPFVKNPELKVGQVAKDAGATVKSFTRVEVGEGIEVAQVDFAAEVAAQLKG